MDVTLKPRDGSVAWDRRRGPFYHDIQQRTTGFFFGRGAGASKHIPGFYSVGTNVDCRFGYAMPGPREEADITGLAAGERIIKIIKHGTSTEVNWAITTTKVYRVEAGAWVAKLSAVTPTGIVSMKGVVAVFMGASTAFQFSSDNGTTWTASTKTGSNAKFGNMGIVQVNGLLAPRCVYGRNPNEVYTTEDLTNSDPTGTTSSYIGDNQAPLQQFNSIVEDDTGLVIFGMRHALFALNDDGTVKKLTKDYPDGVADAGGQSDRNNFEAYDMLDGRIYYGVSGYGLIEYYHGQVNNYMAPYITAEQVPRAHLPINAIATAGEWLVVALGSKNTSTLKNIAQAPGGTSLLGNTFTTASELWMARYQEDEQGNLRWVWHGILLLCTDPLRYMFYDEDTNYLTLASGDSESANLQSTRCYVVPDNPLYHLKDSIIKLNTGTWKLETGRLDFGEPSVVKSNRRIEVHTLNLASTTPSLQVLSRPTSDYSNTAFVSLVTYTSNSVAETGTAFPAASTFRTERLQFVGVADAVNNLYPILIDAELFVEDFPASYDILEFTILAVRGMRGRRGQMRLMSAAELEANLTTWIDAAAPATIKDLYAGDSWSAKITNFSVSGLGPAKEFTLTAQEIA